MKFAEAEAIINYTPVKAEGYRVHFETRTRGMLVSDFFPELDEPGFASEELAWKYARLFAKRFPERHVNVYVIDENFSPVSGYAKEKLNHYP